MFVAFLENDGLLATPTLSEQRYCDARRHAVCVSAALVSAAKVMRCS